MRLGGRLAAAIEILDDIERRHRPAADALKDWGLSHRFAGAGDRAAIGNIVYDALRRRRTAGWLLDGDTPRAVALGALILEGGHSLDGLVAALEGDRFAPEAPTAAEIASIDERRAATPPDSIRSDAPDWAARLLQRAFGEAWVDEAAALAVRPPLDLRVNTLRSDPDRVLRELADAGAEPSPLAPDGLRIPPISGDGRHPNVQVEASFQKGWFEVQDEGSQLAALFARAGPGMQVLDYCAGAGGKTLALAAAMDNRGQVFAHDSEKSRLAPIFERLKRAGARNVQTLSKGGLPALEGQMDLVVVDAPCTGSGTWRRRPDAKWRLGERQLAVRVGEQATILAAASRYVKPGGRLVYITCSVFEEENGDRIRAFLEGAPRFRNIDHSALIESVLPGRADRFRLSASGVVMTPLRTGADGFFVSIMMKDA